jgi:DNA-binding NarL/FixJ family response regulator
MATQLRVLVVEDESFTRQLIANALLQQGFTSFDCASAAEAIQLVKTQEPHVVISDLDLGSGASGHELLKIISRDYPWVGLVVLTAHSNPVLAGVGELPQGVTYLVKSAIADLGEIGVAVNQSISNLEHARPSEYGENSKSDLCVVSASQAETLRLLSQGLTNQAIADLRGTSLRAVENMIQRTYKALSLRNTGDRNQRVEAVSLWRQGKVQVR